MADNTNATTQLGVLKLFIALTLYQLLQIKIQAKPHLAPVAVVLLGGPPVMPPAPTMPPICPLGGPLI
jgi:hypothetical protein